MGRIKDESLFQTLHDYLKKYLPDQKYASPNTVKSYREALNQFFNYLASEKGISLSDITFSCMDYDMEIKIHDIEWYTYFANKMQIGRRALQLINGVINMTLKRSRRFSKDREAMIAGTVQPNPKIMGINARPESPGFLMIPSMTYAT